MSSMDDYRDMFREYLVRKIYLTGEERILLKRIRRFKKYGEKENIEI